MAANRLVLVFRTSLLVFFVLGPITQLSAYGKDIFTEELYLKPVFKEHVYSHFQFTTKWKHNNSFQHYHLFPKALGEVVAKYGVQELHLSQTQGLWRHAKWGYPVHEVPPGAELWVWFKPSVKNIDETWAGLINAVSGLFCASLNFLDAQVTMTPRWSFRPKGLAPKSFSVFSHFVRYGALPRELVCTENLTPWKKLLPCNSKAGLASLFNAFYIHDAEFHSLGTHFRSVCADTDCTEEAVELSQSLSIVVDTSLKSEGTPYWTLKSLFGNHIASACPVASSSQVIVETTKKEGAIDYQITIPEPTRRVNVTRGGSHHSYNVYDIKALTGKGSGVNLVGRAPNQAGHTQTLQPPPIHAHRYLTGYGLEDGGISCLVHNTMDVNVTVIYMEILPWFTRLLLKSLSVENGGQPIRYRLHYRPGKDRVRPYHLELSFNLWPRSTTKVKFSFKRAFLKWTEYPPDANHGFDINSAVITASVPLSYAHTAPLTESSILESLLHEDNTTTRFPVRIHTESLLVSLPTPDFSMPYNVICLACTVVAIAFGSIHNLTTKKFEKIDPSTKKGLLSKLKGLWSRKKGKVAEEEKPTTESSDSPKEESAVK